MHIDFINHSSYVVKSGSISLMCDFWKEGLAFDKGWDLLCETAFGYADFSSITHLWFSHEHPDHFSPENLMQIPEHLRAGITVLFQKTEDKRLVTFCEKKGFKEVIELAPGQPHSLEEGFDVLCEAFGSYWGEVDSWLYIKTPGGTLLNINDCEIHDEETAAAILKRCEQWGGPVELLATQFSYASKQGNASDNSWQQPVRQHYLDLLALKVRMFKPRYVLPFASYVYWCHVDNRYLNDGVVTVHEAIDTINSYAESVVMYPGDGWTLGSGWDNSGALGKYQQRYETIAAMPDDQYQQTDTIDISELQTVAGHFLNKLLASSRSSQITHYLAIKQSLILRRGAEGFLQRLCRLPLHALSGFFGVYQPGKIYVEDHQKAYELSLSGFKAADCSREDCHIAIHSSALFNCFKVSWGGETLQVNGRFEDINGGWELLSQIFYLARKLEQGFKLPGLVTVDFLVQKLR